MALFKKNVQDIIVEAKLAYARGNISEASRLLHSVKYRELREYGEGLYLLAKIYLDLIPQLTDQAEINNKYEVIESYLFRAKELSHKEAKVLYDQYFDTNRVLKVNMTVTNTTKNVVDNKTNDKVVNTDKTSQNIKSDEKQTTVNTVKATTINSTVNTVKDMTLNVDVKEQKTKEVKNVQNNIKSKYEHENDIKDIPVEVKWIIQDCLLNSQYLKNLGHSGTVLETKEEKEMKRVFPSLDTRKIVYYNFTSSLLKKEWFAFTPFDYYDYLGNHANIKNVVKIESFYKSKYYGEMIKLYYKDGSVSEAKFMYNETFVSNFLEKLKESATSIRDKGYQYQNKGDLYNAYQYYLISAEIFDNPEAQNDLGVFYKTGKYVEADVERAIYWYERSAKQNNIHALSNLGSLLRSQKRYDEAIIWLEKALAQGSANAANNLGLCYLNGEGCNVDYDKAIEYFKKASENGNYYGDYNLGRVYTYYKFDYAKAFDYYLKAASKNHTGALNGIGLAYMHGRYASVNYDKALEYFDRSIAIDNGSYAYAHKAYLYATCKNDEHKAQELFNKAIELGWNNYSYIAEIYSQEQFGKVDYEKARYWLEKGVKENHSQSKFELALMYVDGIGVKQDYNKALELLSEDDNNSNIKVLLGRLYIEGKGVPQDITKGLELLIPAINKRCPYAHYYQSCLDIEGNYVSKNESLGLKGLLILSTYKGDIYAYKAKQKLEYYLTNEKYNLIKSCDIKILLDICKVITFDEYPKQQFEIYTRLDNSLENCPSKVYATLAKSYHFGVNTRVDYEKAVSYYEKCLHSKDYTYDSEIEFNYASLRFEGKGCFKDLTYGFKMAIAVGAYKDKCPDGVLPYKKGINTFVNLVFKHIKECRIYEYIHYAAKYIDLDKPEVAEFREIIEANEGKFLYATALVMVEKLQEFKNQCNEEIQRIVDEKKYDWKYQEDSKKRSLYSKEKEREYDIVETLLKAADYGSFEAIEYLSENYSVDLVYNNIYPVENYDFRLMRYYDDEGIIEQAKLLTYSWKYDEAIIKLREIIVSRKSNDNLLKALKLVYENIPYNEIMYDLDDIYLETFGYKALTYLKLSLMSERKVVSYKLSRDRTPLSQYVYIDFDVYDTADYEDFLCDEVDYDMFDDNMKNVSLLNIKNRRVMKLLDMMAYRPDDVESLLSYGDNIKFEFTGLENLKDGVFTFIENYVRDSDYKKWRGKNIEGEYSMLPVKLTFIDNDIYTFWSEDISKFIKVDKNEAVYVPDFFTDRVPTYMILKGNTPLLVFNVEKQKRML